MASDREYQRAVEAAEDTKVRVEVERRLTGEPLATVVWGSWISDGVPRHGGAEGPMSVPEALLRADEVAKLYGFADVVVQISDERLWHPDWGVLRSEEAEAEDDDDDESYGSTAEPDGDEVPPTKQWI